MDSLPPALPFTLNAPPSAMLVRVEATQPRASRLRRLFVDPTPGEPAPRESPPEKPSAEEPTLGASAPDDPGKEESPPAEPAQETPASEEPTPPAAMPPAEPVASPARRRWVVAGVVGLICLLVLGVGGRWLTELPPPVSAPPTPVDGAPAQSPTDTAQPSLAMVPAPGTHTVEAGDTLGDLAERLGISIEALRVANDLANPDLVPLGQVLVVPPAPYTAEAVDPTQTLRALAVARHLDPVSLAAYNGLPPERVDRPLDRAVLLIPDLTRFPASPEVQEAPAAVQVYVVEEGDSLLTIADQFGVDPQVLIQLNRLTNPDLIQVGQELRVPAQE